MKDYDYVFKVVIVGDSGVGKTSLFKRYTDGVAPLDRHVVTLGMDFKVKTVELKELQKVAKIQFWDSVGQEKFQSLTKQFWRGAHGLVVVFALDSAESYEHAKTRWVPDIQKFAADTCEHIMLVGNKSDIASRVVSKADAEAFAAANQMVYAESSAMTNENVTEMFYNFCLTLTKVYAEKHVEDRDEPPASPITHLQPPPGFEQGNKKGCGC
jgi:Ras-related protein Rab-1A